MTLPLVSVSTGKYGADVNTNTVASPVWVPIRGILEFTPPEPEPTLQDDTDYDSVPAGAVYGGWKSQAKTALSHTTKMKVKRGYVAGTGSTKDPGQEFLRAAGRSLDPTVRVVNFRYYERVTGGSEAYSGFGEVAFSPDGGKVEDIATATITLSGVGALTAITNPS
jgi:hypothetical protein